jgi:quercetin dioxygenase-like cupin family protein
MNIKRASARPTKMAPEDKFTGQVWQDEVLVGEDPSRMRATNVSFSLGARTAWHATPSARHSTASLALGESSWRVSKFRSCIQATRQ